MVESMKRVLGADTGATGDGAMGDDDNNFDDNG